MASHAPAAENDENSPLLAGRPRPGHAYASDDEGRLRRGYKTLWARSLEIGLYRIAGVTIIVGLVLAAALYPKMHSNTTAELCLTPACIHAASGYLTNLSPNYKNLDPCGDFEEYVCGGWRGAHDLRADEGRVDALSLINDVITSNIRGILEGNYPEGSSHSEFSPRNLVVALSSTDQDNFDELKQVYNACMDVDAITKRGIEPIIGLIDDLAAILNSTDGDYSEAILFLRGIGIDPFFNFGVGDDEKNPERQIISVSPKQSVGLPSKLHFNDKGVVAKYQDAVTQVLGAINPKVASIGKGGDAAAAAAALVEFENKISQAGPDRSDVFDVTKTYNLMSVKDTAKLVPQFNLEKVFKKLIPGGYDLKETVTAFPERLANVSEIVSSAPKEVIHNYLYWRIITSYSRYVLGSEIKPYTQFQNVLQGKDPNADPERWRTCVRHADDTLGWILSRFFVEAAFSAAAKDFGNQIITDIKSAYLRNFASLSWMDKETEEVAAQKVHNIDQKVGYPSESPNIMDPEDLRKYYADVNITHSYFDNALTVTHSDTAREWESLSKPTNMKEWGMSASTVNAYYNPTHNEIVFPAAIMQFPLFSVDLPSYVSYGAFGAVAGHELSHAFDNNGRHYDLHGRYSNWWTNATIEAFEAKAECIVEEFNNITLIGKDGPINVNGRQTLGENIADSGGLTAARSAWDARRKDSKSTKDKSLPGLEHFTHEQMFYISYSNAWCSKFRPESLTNLVQTDEHSPDPARIKGTIANSRGFREAFSCPNKEPTCELW